MLKSVWQAAGGSFGKDRAPTCCRPVSRVEAIGTSSVRFLRIPTLIEHYEILFLAIPIINYHTCR